MKNINKIRERISHNPSSIVITGDSLSYNRYDFDCTARTNAYDCYPGMPSWSFLLRDAIWQNDPYFCFGSQIAGEGNFIEGNFSNDSKISPYYLLNGGKTKTSIITGNTEEVSLYISSCEPQIIMYLQKRPQESCVFDIYSDGVLRAANVDNLGDLSYFQGWAPFKTLIGVDQCLDVHTITFKNIRKKSDEAFITVAAIGNLSRRVALTGQGSTQISFLIDNFYERIGSFSPDLLVFTSGANDARHMYPEVYRANLEKLFELIYGVNPECGVLALCSTDSHNPQEPDSDETPYFSRKSYEPMRAALSEVCKKYDGCFFDTLQFFESVPLKKWRFDNVHMTKFGSDMLFSRLYELLLK